ncbi:hypothetical protein [Sulfuriferula nivalis]|uniref:Uncharacterized protein n=1 Tax=Sulfuriferula nivalis TaxID=2675298 RepID=A0A809RPM7_9PROT|nr:hypothetical protein [Sulfuriferula nivalis]BBP00791.1 hypothetical protein SFSGTM_14990 [Sulfuriferula nivalis]
MEISHTDPAHQRNYTEIKLAARYDAVLVAEGAFLLLEKLSPALKNVDSSSGAAVNRAIATLVLIIIKADVSQDVRHLWMERLWQALQEDTMSYIESLGNQFVVQLLALYLIS